MKRAIGPFLITLVLVVISGFTGAWIGAKVWQPAVESHAGFHESLFQELELSKSQEELLEALEILHADENKDLQKSLSEANNALANILEIEGEYGAEIEQAIDNVHTAMFELQKTTIKHLYEMRDILEPHQKVVFDRHVSKTFREYTQ